MSGGDEQQEYSDEGGRAELGSWARGLFFRGPSFILRISGPITVLSIVRA